MQAPFGLVKDLATAPWRDEEEFDGFVNVLWGRTVHRLGQVAENTIGPKEGLGAVFGAAPEGVRKPVRGVTEPILRGAETVYREGISEPITTAITAGSLASRPGGGGIAGLLDAENYRKGYKIAQDRSPGQALSLAFGTKDITDDAEVTKWVGSDWHDVISGTADAVLRWKGDPTVVAGKVGAVARTKYLVRPIASAADINKAARSGRLAKFNEAVEGLNPAEIRHRFFPDHQHGAVISTVLAEAGDSTTRIVTLRALMGDVEAKDALSVDRPALAGKVSRLTDERNVLVHYGDDSLFADPGRLATVQAELDELYPQMERAARLEAASATLREVPRVSLAGTVRDTITRSDFYQASPLAAPLRVTFNMRPQQIVNLHDQASDVQVARMLNKSDLPREVQDSIRGEYMAQLTDAGRQAVLLKAEAQAVASIARNAGMSVDEIQKVLTEAGKGRGKAAEVLQSRVYDGKGRSVIRYQDAEGWQEMHLPIFITQNANLLPLVNLDHVRDAARGIGEYRKRFGQAAKLPDEMLTGFYKVWRPAVLLRGAWPIRVVGDESARIIAKIGALTHVTNLNRARLESKALRAEARAAVDGDDALAGLSTRERRAAVAAAAKERNVGLPFSIGDTEMQRAFGAPGDAANTYRALVSSRSSFGALVDQVESTTLNKLRESTGEWRSIEPTHVDYGPAWEHQVNRQLAQDAAARKLIAGESVDDVVRWLQTTDEGRAYLSRNKVRGANPRRWMELQAEVINDYLPTPRLRELALRRRATADDLVRELPDASQRPIVAGEITQQALGKSTISKAYNDLVERGFNWLGAKPSDTLSRNPFFDHMYRAEAQRLADLAMAQGVPLTPALFNDIAGKSREFALGETRKLLYDLAERSELGEILRHFSPFYSAWQEVISRWTGLAVENPAFVARMRLVWNSPEKAGIVTDENGNRVREDGTAIGPDGKPVKPGNDRYITLPIPDFIKDIPGMKGLKNQGAIRLNKESFNMALQGWPGFGPPVQIAANEIAKSRPDLEESLKLILPFGTSHEWKEMVFPATYKRLNTLVKGEEDRKYRNTVMRVYFDKMVDYNLGKREDKPTFVEAEKETNDFWKLRMVASFISPAAPSFSSPYQLYIDAYRQLREADPTTADERFLERYGAEYFPLTQSMSRSTDGVPPTLEGYRARKRYKDMVEKYPELGGLIVGSEGAGEFASAVYSSQLASKLRPGSDQHQRETPSFEETAAKPNERLGWMQFGKAMDLIDAERVQRGLPNLQVKAARDLAVIKRAVIERLAEQYPEWYAAFSVTDRNKMERRIKGMREIANDSRLSGREDIAGLRLYLQARDLMAAELAKRKAAGESSTLTASDNADLAVVWETITGKLVESNLAFGALFHRYLERDQPEAA